MASITLTINNSPWTGDVPDTSMPLLWVLRDIVGATGTKFGCGVTACSACVVLVNGAVQKTCTENVANFVGKKITTIEGLAAMPATLSGVTGAQLQQAWVDSQVPQCGYCQSGMLLAVYALLNRIAKPTDADIDTAIQNLCACGTYPRVRATIKRLTGQTA